MSSKCDMSVSPGPLKMLEWEDEDLEDLESVSSGGEPGEVSTWTAMESIRAIVIVDMSCRARNLDLGRGAKRSVRVKGGFEKPVSCLSITGSS